MSPAAYIICIYKVKGQRDYPWKRGGTTMEDKKILDNEYDVNDIEVLNVEELEGVSGGARRRVAVKTTVVDKNGHKKTVIVYMYADQLSEKDKKIYGIT